MSFRQTIILTAAVLLGSCSALLQAESASMATLLDKRVTFLGDSISEAGGYITFVEYYLTKHYPTHQIDIIGLGLSSETTSGLTEKVHPGPRPCILNRLKAALEQEGPAVVVACYGMNDGIYLPLNDQRRQAFVDGQTSLIAQVRAAGADMVILTPPIFDATRFGTNVVEDDSGPGYTKPYAKYDEVLANYSAWIMSVHKPHLITIDLHTPMASYLASRRQADPQYILSGDGIHPGDVGHLLMARLFLKGMGMPLPGEDLDKELAAIVADPLYALVKTHREQRSRVWLAYSRGGPKDAVDAEERDAKALLATIDEQRRK